MTQDLIIRSGIIVRPGHPLQRLDILVRDGRIAALIQPGEAAPDNIPVEDVTGLHVFPGCIDAHVHFGFGEKITEYEQETAHAAHGGITSILGYLLNNEDYGEVYARESAYARERCRVDYGFHFSTASEIHLKSLESYIKDYGVTSFKFFMNFKGEEGRYLGLDGTDDGYLYELLGESFRLGKPTIVCHTENIEIVNRVRRRVQAEGGESLRDWARAKPAFTEAENCVRAMMFAEHLKARVYFPHISSRFALDEVRKWRQRYQDVHVETCPHYLTHTENSEQGTLAKANPPLRSEDDREALWEGIADGSIQVVASDHSARRRATKEKPMWLAAQGFPGTAAIIPVLLHEGHHKRGLPLQRIAEVMTSGPARVFDLWPRKGQIEIGSDADFTVVDLHKERVFSPEELGSYSDYSLYENRTLKGWPVRTIVRGTTVMRDGKLTGQPGFGQFLRRSLVDRV